MLDMEFVKKLLMSLVGTRGAKSFRNVNIAGHPKDAVNEYLKKLAEAGLVESLTEQPHGAWARLRITSKGYEFLSVSLDGSLWKQVKLQATQVRSVGMLPAVVVFALKLGGF